MNKELVKLANHLDSLGHRDLADRLDTVIQKTALPSLSDIGQAFGFGGDKEEEARSEPPETPASGGEEQGLPQDQTNFISVNLPYPLADLEHILKKQPQLLADAVLGEVMKASGEMSGSLDEAKRLEMIGWLIDETQGMEGVDLTGGAGKQGYLASKGADLGVPPERSRARRQGQSMKDLSGGLIHDEATGNEFRAWANENHNAKADYDLDPSGNWNNSYMRKAWAALGEQYKAHKSGGAAPSAPAEWEEGQTHRESSSGATELNLSDPAVQELTQQILVRLKKGLRAEGARFWIGPTLTARKAWAVRHLMGLEMGQEQAEGIVDEMLQELRAEAGSNAEDGFSLAKTTHVTLLSAGIAISPSS